MQSVRPYIYVAFACLLLFGCGDDTIVRKEGEASLTVILSVASKDEIYIQGSEGKLNWREFEKQAKIYATSPDAHAFVIQSWVGEDLAEKVKEVLVNAGIKPRFVAIAREST